MEVYKIIPNYPDYAISNLGNLKNNHTGRILKTWFGGKQRAYEYGRIINENGMKKTTIHKLVALCFLDDKPLNTEIDHIDRNSKNNNANNLRYLSRHGNLMNKNYELNARKNNILNEHHIYKNEWSYVFEIRGKYICSCNDLNELIKIRDEYILNNPI